MPERASPVIGDYDSKVTMFILPNVQNAPERASPVIGDYDRVGIYCVLRTQTVPERASPVIGDYDVIMTGVDKEK